MRLLISRACSIKESGIKLSKAVFAIFLAPILLLAACGSDPGLSTDGRAAEQNTASASTMASSGVEKSINIVITVENMGEIHAELYPEIAPLTVANFQKLIAEGFYDGLTFHRAVPGFMIQGGDPQGDGSGGPGYTIKGEFKNNKVENALKHGAGVLSMARRADSYDSAGSQFFIMLGAAPHLDGEYAAFGKVVSGFEVVEEIAAQTIKGQSLTPAIKILSIKFE